MKVNCNPFGILDLSMLYAPVWQSSLTNGLTFHVCSLLFIISHTTQTLLHLQHSPVWPCTPSQSPRLTVSASTPAAIFSCASMECAGPWVLLHKKETLIRK